MIEKPIADDLVSARALAEASRTARVPVLVGHHRRHNPVVRAAKKVIGEGRIGKLVVANIPFLRGNEWRAFIAGQDALVI